MSSRSKASRFSFALSIRFAERTKQPFAATAIVARNWNARPKAELSHASSAAAGDGGLRRKQTTPLIRYGALTYAPLKVTTLQAPASHALHARRPPSSQRANPAADETVRQTVAVAAADRSIDRSRPHERSPNTSAFWVQCNARCPGK